MLLRLLGFAVLVLAFHVKVSAQEPILRFQNWQVPAVAKVVVNSETTKGKATASFVITLREHHENFVLSVSDFKLLAVNGEDRSSPGFLENAKIAERALAGSMADMLISSEGEFLGLTDWENWVDNFVESFYDFDGTRTEKKRLKPKQSYANPPISKSHFKPWARIGTSGLVPGETRR